MTINGGKPHAVGDQGQRFEVSYYDPREKTRKIFGWTDSMDTVEKMLNSIKLHPSFSSPEWCDRKSPCYLGDGEVDHDWEYISDSAGDPNVIGGTMHRSYWECKHCGKIDEERGSPEDDF